MDEQTVDPYHRTPAEFAGDWESPAAGTDLRSAVPTRFTPDPIADRSSCICRTKTSARQMGRLVGIVVPGGCRYRTWRVTAETDTLDDQGRRYASVDRPR